MTKPTMTSITLAAALAVGAMGLSMSSASAADQMTEQEQYNKALTDCEMLDKPDRRQLCKDQAMEKHEQYQKTQNKDGMKNTDKSKTKQY